MCGVAGFLSVDAGKDGAELKKIAIGMREALVHRGPDDAGVWVDEACGIALCHRRLSILDLSPEGRQPMGSFCGRYIIAFNGEIYNYKEIRSLLEEQFKRQLPQWRGHSDTEIMLAAISMWGIEKSLQYFNGMFAFALWDRRDRILRLGRDRLGEKPLYYGWAGNTFLFGSELKALREHPDFKCVIDRDALALYMRQSYIPGPFSIYEGIRKLAPGTFLTLKPLGRRIEPNLSQYWSVKEQAEQGEASPFVGSSDDALTALDHLLRDAVKLRMEADVPLGAFLSGGIDSSIIAALMQAQNGKPIRTFSIGFHETGYDEAPHAKAVAGFLKTNHTELYVSAQQAMAVIPILPTLYDEPFADTSQIPTFLVSQLARNHVAVSLSGDGGDELFGGYSRYFWGDRIRQAISCIPGGLRQSWSRLLVSTPPDILEGVFNRLSPILPRALKQYQAGDKLHKLGEILAANDPESVYLNLISRWKNPSSVVLKSSEPATVLTNNGELPCFNSFISKMMFLDSITYLPDDILVKVDRASMGVSLEARTPFLDHRIVKLAWQLPLSMKLRAGQGKWILKQLLYKYAPQRLFDRPKMGFGVPIDSWLRGPLQGWAESLLDERRLTREGYFDPLPIRRKWLEHLSGKRNWQYHLWNVLMFQAWLEIEPRRSANI